MSSDRARVEVAQDAEPTAERPEAIVDVRGLNVWYGKVQALFDVDMKVERNSVTALIGPSGCGKSTLVRTMNRLHELVPNTRLTGSVVLDGQDIYGDGVDAAD